MYQLKEASNHEKMTPYVDAFYLPDQFFSVLKMLADYSVSRRTRFVSVLDLLAYARV
jgi:hypothetical protein